MADQRKTERVNRTAGDMRGAVRAQVRDMAQDLEQELRAAGATGLYWGVGGLLIAAGVTALFLSLGLKVSGRRAGGTLGVGLGLLGASAACLVGGWRALPADELERMGAKRRVTHQLS